jgi:hypothetical protein
MPTCHLCGQALKGEDSTCPECGASTSQPTASFEPVGAEARAGSAAVEDASESPVLVVRKGPQLGERFYLETSRLTIGRDPTSDIFLNDMTVSRTHALFDRTGTGASITDAGSLNGTYVNGECVDATELSNGDVVQIGTFQMVYYAGEGPRR